MSIYTKTGERIVDVSIDSDCYFDGHLLQVRVTIEGELAQRLLYISDLREDHKDEIKSIVRATLRAAQQR